MIPCKNIGGSLGPWGG